MTTKFAVIIIFHNKILHLLILLVSEFFSNSLREAKPYLHNFLFNSLLVHTAIIVLMTLSVMHIYFILDWKFSRF